MTPKQVAQEAGVFSPFSSPPLQSGLLVSSPKKSLLFALRSYSKRSILNVLFHFFEEVRETWSLPIKMQK